MTDRADTAEAMQSLGAQAAQAAGPGDVFALVGDLGAGKTHWTKGFVAGLGSPAEVTSPTFGLVHEYPGGRIHVYHLDFYRLENESRLLGIGWDELLEQDAVIVAEWADRFPSLLPAGTIRLDFHIEPDGTRRIDRSVL